jgi:RNA polymerase sigma-70 factor (TIGR02960 family)
MAAMSVAALERACAGDERAFSELVAPHLRELHLHCYRMLGSLADADDVLQEVLLAAWSALGGFAGRSSLRTWLYRIATNRCLNEIRSGRRRARVEPQPPFVPPPPSRHGDVAWLGPYPDAELDPPDPDRGPAARYEGRQDVELAFVAAVQRLPPRQAAALLLCDVLDFPLAEVADLLGTTTTAGKGLLQRARAGVQGAGSGSAGGGVDRPSVADLDVARRFAEAFTRDDVAGVVALLTDDAWLAMPPAPHEYHGREAVGGFLEASRVGRAGRTLLLVPTRANGQPAYGCFVRDPDGRSTVPSGIVVLTTAGGAITGITRFLDPALPARFGIAAPDGGLGGR